MKQWLVKILMCLSIVNIGCKETYTPKPHGYLRIDLPKDHKYVPTPRLNAFSSEMSYYAKWQDLENKTVKNRKNKWYDIIYAEYNAKVHLSYFRIDNNLDSLLEESYKFAYEHTVRANSIDETPYHFDDKNVHGVLYNLEGNSASNMEFWATDSTEHFLRGALYFATTPNVDSMQPLINYIKKDLTHFVEKINWHALNSNN